MKNLKLNALTLGFGAMLFASPVFAEAPPSQPTVSKEVKADANEAKKDARDVKNDARDKMASKDRKDAKMDDDVVDFILTANQDGNFEVEAAKLVLTKSGSKDVKAFAKQMVTDHGKAGAELNAIAKKKGRPFDKTMAEKHSEKLADFQKLAGVELDRKYVKTMVDAHEDAVDLFEKQSKDDDDADLKAFATKTLPTLKHHLQMAKDLDAKLDRTTMK